MTYQSTVRRLTLVTAILVAIALTLFLTAPFAKGIHWPKLVLRTTRPRERPPSAEGSRWPGPLRRAHRASRTPTVWTMPSSAISGWQMVQTSLESRRLPNTLAGTVADKPGYVGGGDGRALTGSESGGQLR